MFKMFRKPRKMGLLKEGLVGLIACAAGILSCNGDGGNGGSVPGPVYSDYKNLSGKTHGAVIAPQIKLADYDNLVDLRRKQGLMFEQVALGDIYAAYPVAYDDAERVRMFLQDEATNPDFKFVLLDKDAPIRKVLFDGVEEIPTDLYFSDIDDGTGQFNHDYDWDADSNDDFGELGDNLNFWPDVYVSRAPGNIANFISRMLEYETTPNTEQLEKMLMIASDLDASTNTSDNAELIIANYLPAHFVTGIAKEYNTGNAACRNAWSLSPAIANFDGYGERNAIGTLWIDGAPPTTENLLIADISDPNLTNDKIPCLVYNASCNTAAFDDVAPGDCIAEVLLNKSLGKFLGYIGNTRQSNPIPGKYYSQEFYRELFDSLRDDCRLGEVFAKHKLGKIYGSEGYLAEMAKIAESNYRKAQFTLVLMGPVGNDIFTKYEGDFRSGVVDIQRGDYLEIIVDDGVPIEGAKVCVDDGTNVYSALTDSDGRVILPVSEPTASVNVTKHNWIPYIE